MNNKLQCKHCQKEILSKKDLIISSTNLMQNIVYATYHKDCANMSKKTKFNFRSRELNLDELIKRRKLSLIYLTIVVFLAVVGFFVLFSLELTKYLVPLWLIYFLFFAMAIQSHLKTLIFINKVERFCKNE
ncbi:MAG: hypothetical protein ACP5N2_07015 [Candidatus Nanoarchaeia archaeon]